ncbi:MAG: glutamate-cysteine ligase family protein [Pirellulaceae bacterium]
MPSDNEITPRTPIAWFEAFGVELEYMIVRADTLDVAPIADQLLVDDEGQPSEEIERDDLAWSNELALHVLEMKTNGPVRSLEGLAERFQADVREANLGLGLLGTRLMPTAMHPWMRPEAEMKLWPHGYNEVYEAFNKIFDCRGHGWANLQSTHLNLPFYGDDQFGPLHAAIRLVLPILPALTASSPWVEGGEAGELDHRLNVYRHNAAKVPSVSGMVIPERVYTREDYEQQILEKIYTDLAPHDPGKILRHEWANARGAIARFDRSAIEIRVMDVQECPVADVAICQLVALVTQALCQQRWSESDAQKLATTESLAELLWRVTRTGAQAEISDPTYLAHFGWQHGTCTAGQLWKFLAQQTILETSPFAATLQTILTRGPLAQRIVEAIGGDSGRLVPTYRRLCDCLEQGELFLPETV